MNDPSPILSRPIFSTAFIFPDYGAIQNAPTNSPAPVPGTPGTFENYAASIIHELASDEQMNAWKTLTDALYTLGLTGKVGTKKIGDTRIELQVGRLSYERTGETDMVSIADVGFGVSQVLPILVALIVCGSGTIGLS